MIKNLYRLASTVFFCIFSSASSATVVSTNTDYVTIDASEMKRDLKVTLHGAITDLNLVVDFSKCDDPFIGPAGEKCLGRGNPFEDEFSLILVSPDGVQVNLVEPWSTYNGARHGIGRVSVMFDDQAPSVPGPAILGGTYRPAEKLDAFNGKDMFGTWSLLFRDYGAGDPLEFFSTKLDITYATPEPAQVPEPGTIAMIGLGIIGIRVVRAKGNYRV
jgi:hypothetical protein